MECVILYVQHYVALKTRPPVRYLYPHMCILTHTYECRCSRTLAVLAATLRAWPYLARVPGQSPCACWTYLRLHRACSGAQSRKARSAMRRTRQRTTFRRGYYDICISWLKMERVYCLLCYICHILFMCVAINLVARDISYIVYIIYVAYLISYMAM